MAGSEGWIKVHRSIQEHWIWQDPIKLKWWLDIILLANHKDSKILLGNELLDIKIGEHHTSILKLSERWKVDRKTIKRFLNLLQNDNMISMEISKKGATLKVTNYKAYQSITEGESPNKEGNTRDNGEDNGVSTGSQYGHNKGDTNKNEKNVKNDKNEKKVCLGEFENVFLKQEEYEKLLSTHTKDLIDKYINKLSEYMESNGKAYKSHYATIKRWIREDEEKKNTAASTEVVKKKDEYAYDMGKIRRQLLGLDKPN